MNELDELMKQKKEIERKIRELKNTTIICGKVRYEIVNLPRGAEHTISIVKRDEYSDHDRHYAVIAYKDKNKALEELDVLENDIREMKAVLGGENHG